MLLALACLIWTILSFIFGYLVGKEAGYLKRLKEEYDKACQELDALMKGKL